MCWRQFVVVTGIVAALTAPAAAVELCLAIDGSGSINGPDFTLQLSGIADAVTNPAVVPQNGTVSLSVVQFGSGAVLEISPTLISDASSAASFAAAVNAIVKDNGSTNMAAAIDLCVQQGFDFGPGQKQVIDLSTDGEPNSDDDARSAATNAVQAGVDAINALGVGAADIAFLQTLVQPQPSKQPPADGFVIAVVNFQEYVDAIADKLRAEIFGVYGEQAAPAAGGWALGILTLVLPIAGSRMVRRHARKAKR